MPFGPGDFRLTIFAGGANEYDGMYARVTRKLANRAHEGASNECVQTSVVDGLMQTYKAPHFLPAEDFERLWGWNAINRFNSCLKRRARRRSAEDEYVANSQTDFSQTDFVVAGSYYASGCPEEIAKQISAECLEKLDERERFYIKNRETMQHQEMADALNCSPATITTVSKSAVRKLATCVLMSDYYRCVCMCEIPPDPSESSQRRGFAIRRCEATRPYEVCHLSDGGTLRMVWYTKPTTTECLNSSGVTFTCAANTLMFQLDHPMLPPGTPHAMQLTLMADGVELGQIEHDGKRARRADGEDEKTNWGMPLNVTVDPTTKIPGTEVVYEYHGDGGKKKPSDAAISLSLQIQL